MPRHADRFTDGLAPTETIFGRFLRANKISYAAAGDALGISRQYANLLARQKRPVTMELALKIAEWSRSLGGEVSIESWPNLREQIKEMRRLNLIGK